MKNQTAYIFIVVSLLFGNCAIASPVNNLIPVDVITRITSVLPQGDYSGRTSDGVPCQVLVTVQKLGAVNFFTVDIALPVYPQQVHATYRSPWNGDVFSNFTENHTGLSVVFEEVMDGVPSPHDGTILKLRKNSNGIANAVFLEDYGVGNSATTCLI